MAFRISSGLLPARYCCASCRSASELFFTVAPSPAGLDPAAAEAAAFEPSAEPWPAGLRVDAAAPDSCLAGESLDADGAACGTEIDGSSAPPMEAGSTWERGCLCAGLMKCSSLAC